jgi:hypothetical protein
MQLRHMREYMYAVLIFNVSTKESDQLHAPATSVRGKHLQ